MADRIDDHLDHNPNLRLMALVGGAAASFLAYKLSERGQNKGQNPSLGSVALAAIGSTLLNRGMNQGSEGNDARSTTDALDSISKNISEKIPGLQGLANQNLELKSSIEINKSPLEVYQFWRDFENLPRFTEYLESVKRVNEKRSHWVAKFPGGVSFEWDAEIIEDMPGRLLAWEAVKGSTVPNSGTVWFKQGNNGRGTEISIRMNYQPPGGVLAVAMAKFFGADPDKLVYSDLKRLKSYLETGNVKLNKDSEQEQRRAHG